MLAGREHLVHEIFDAHLRNFIFSIAHQLAKGILLLLSTHIHSTPMKHKLIQMGTEAEISKLLILHPPPVALVDRSRVSFRFLAARMMDGALDTSAANCEVNRGKLMAVKPA